MRIAICGVSSESCAFSRHRTTRGDFVELRGQALLDSYGLAERLPPGLADGVQWLPLLVAAATPGGPVEGAVFDGFVDEIVDGLERCGPIDGVYLDLHGAVSVADREHAEEEMVRRIRGVIGAAPVISASMDPHGNLSRELVAMLDLAAAHRHAPHIDQEDTRTRAIVNLLQVVASGQRPVKVWCRIPVLLPGERTATTVEPGRTVLGASARVAEREGIVDANLWTGFAWADEPRCTAAVLVTATDESAGRAGAEELSELYWDHRAGFGIASPRHGSLDQALDHVLAGAERPCFISDSGDNVTAGASGDVTYALQSVLDRDDLATAGRTVLVAGLFDPATVDRAVAAGVGAVLTEPIGAWLDDRFAPPVAGPWTVAGLVRGPLDDEITAAVVRRGTVSVSVQTRRVLFGTLQDSSAWPFDLRGLSPVDTADFDAVIVKNGYLLPSQEARAGSSFLAITPGATDVDTGRLGHVRVQRPLHPLDDDFQPVLAAEVVPAPVGS